MAKVRVKAIEVRARFDLQQSTGGFQIFLGGKNLMYLSIEWNALGKHY